MHKEIIIEILRYVFDCALLAVVWTQSHIALLNIEVMWNDSFGIYADVARITMQVLVTAMIAITAFYRMRREFLKFRKEKKDKNSDPQD